MTVFSWNLTIYVDQEEIDKAEANGDWPEMWWDGDDDPPPTAKRVDVTMRVVDPSHEEPA